MDEDHELRLDYLYEAWTRHHSFPPLQPTDSLYVTPVHNWVNRLLITVGSWSDEHLKLFIEDMGDFADPKDPRFMISDYARNLIVEALDAEREGGLYVADEADIISLITGEK